MALSNHKTVRGLWNNHVLKLIFGRHGQLLLDLLCSVNGLHVLLDFQAQHLLQTYDGVRRSALPLLYSALEPGTDDDRMKGALWTLHSAWFSKYASSGWSSVHFRRTQKNLRCQIPRWRQNLLGECLDVNITKRLVMDKAFCYVLTFGQPSIQNALSAVSENGSSFYGSKARR